MTLVPSLGKYGGFYEHGKKEAFNTGYFTCGVLVGLANLSPMFIPLGLIGLFALYLEDDRS